ncbi:MAG: hypothetical protein D8M58_18580 [Calditrichaeota bacterium]|nr:MAG: hypothetical protein DWQ03_11810 [Calditrichota bacterium]MBL1207416.1 hypothetical protein [Calditrichota bacterium]NOG47248.1 hypothetical protein [Calditrichota bacterium]
MVRNIFTIFLSFIILYSCVSSSGIKSSFTPTTNNKYKNHSKEIELYFEGSLPVYGFTQIGFVEANGHSDTSYGLMIAHLKYQAYSKGADAIINVNRIFKNESKVTNDSNRTEYSYPVFSGVAIKYLYNIDNDSVYTTPNKNNFNDKVKEDIKKTEYARKRNTIVWTLVFVTLVAGIALFIKNTPEPPKLKSRLK